MRMNIWTSVAATRGKQMVLDGFLTEDIRAQAEKEYQAWVTDEARSMTMVLNAVEGVRPCE
ncbi:hypothetical protein G4V62_07800 [Bacillaceae bacterium SIJ1]|uniref:hypothetical protein n=1 Tax=Litoribacterium kuwaitense TaxID=1398745 RepID=UPI0013EE2F78|nr:hypothetical protein [Litoribacterium kuwaitense]NGP44865.1 hypothetical protein [Litoribacterium kuwaitense]